MKKIISLSFLLSSLYLLMAANVAPTFGPIGVQNIIQCSGQNIILLNNVSDGDAEVQNISFTATSSNTNIVVVDSITFNKNHNFALLYVTEFGIKGNSVISITAKDDGGGTDTYSTDITVNVIKSPVTGATLDIFDNPTNNRDFPNPGEIPLLSKIVQTFNPVEISSFNSQKFLAAEYGYFIPAITAYYGFYVQAASKGWLYFSKDDNPSNVEMVCNTSDPATQGYNSKWLPLIAGKKYYIKANYRNQFSQPSLSVKYTYKLQMTDPIQPWVVIGNDFCVPYNDKANPTVPKNFSLLTKGITDVLLSWNKSTDDVRFEGYNVYVNGNLYNGAIITDTSVLVSGLTAQTSYSFVVRSVDYFKKLSAVSNVIHLTTYPVDNIKPAAPTGIKSLNTTGVAIKIGWNKATDGQTEIRGYNVFVNGIKFNSTLVRDTFCTIKGLTPKTSYNVKIISVDAGYNQSDSSALFIASTIGFDPLNNSDGVAKGQVSFSIDPICHQSGLGLQIKISEGATALVKELNPGAIRKGGIDANSDNFSTYSAGGASYAAFLKAANDMNAVACFTLGVANTTDYYKDSTTVVKFMEYLAGPVTSTWGAKRNAEGFPDLMTKCRGIVIEFGNEVWGGASHQSPFANGAEYTLWARKLARQIKKSPYYQQYKDKIYLAYSGRSVNEYVNNWNSAILPADTGQIDWLSVSGYMGGNMNYDPLIETDRSEIQYLKNGNKSAAHNLSTMTVLQKAMLKNNGRILPMYMYEGNMTTPSYRGRMGQAIVFSDYYISMSERGVAVPIIFVLGSNCEWCLLNGSNKLPLFHIATLFNKYCKNTTALKTQFTTNDPIYDGNNKIIPNYTPVGCHAYYDSGRYRMVLINRDFEKDMVVRIDLPDGLAFSNNATIHKIVSASDFSSENVISTSTPITNFKDSMLVTIPKYSMMLITFDGPVQNFPAQPIYNTKIVKATKLSIESTDNRYTINGANDYLMFKANIEPANAFMPDVSWELVNNNIKAMFLLGANRLRGSGLAGGDGTVIVKATTIDGSNLSDQKSVTISGQVALEDYKDETGVIVYPNPAKDAVTIMIPKEKADVTILSSMGVPVLNKNMESSEAIIDVSHLPSGMYMISVLMDGKRSIRKMIKE